MNNPNISAKKKFNILIKLMHNEKYCSVPTLIEDNETINDTKTKCDLLNQHFASKSTVPNPNQTVPDLDPICTKDKLNTINTSPIEVAKLIRLTKKSRKSFCGISGKFLSLIATPVSFSLSRLFNNLFEQGIYPDIWKLSHITPIYKRSGQKSSKLNYRPISLLPTLSKVCEAVMHNRLLRHCEENNIITDRQAAYLKGDSTINQLITIVHKVKQSWTKGHTPISVFLDISAAFDKVWHKGLLAKLGQIGVECTVLALF